MVFPKATISEIIGLLEAVNDAGGIEDAARLAADFDLELDEILPSIDGAELLGFVSVNNGNIELTQDARKLLDAGIRERKKIMRDKVAGVHIIKELKEKLMKSQEHRMSKSETLRFLQKRISTSDIESYFRIIINWARHAGLLHYNSDHEEICLMADV
ncbi:MAG: AAA-associated domain-containing protein [Candidatus Methanoperedens sp.]|nr:AAA-associated domain-containing protein [Candidatus Methanoperedens sp.]MCZ7359951.1 AAA-associated domain-containing protein [Candidatus Methanoperedens sp.]HLB70118.1 AAA-associated domain-containing protein [Candidatus Methanoperedens sp.]